MSSKAAWITLFVGALGCGADKPAAREADPAPSPVETRADPAPRAPEPSARPVETASAAPSAAPTAAGPEAGPGYPMEGVTATLRRAKERFLVCAELEAAPSPAVLRFVIDERGKVAESAYWRGESSVKPDARQACSLLVLRSLEFPPPPKGKLTITYPLIEEAL